MKKIAVLLSGRGSNFVSIKKKIDEGAIKGEIVAVISNKADSKGLEFAREQGLEAIFVNPKEFDGREAYDRELVRILKEKGVELVCLAGFMRIISPYFVSEFRNRILNIHPSLLPSFKGLDAQKQAFEYGVKFAGCTVHFVDEEMDHGNIILQAVVPVLQDDDDHTLAERILKEEHRIYPEAVALFCEDRLKVEGRKVFVI
ncbi:phosphoribosylglycinamide formyltransferase [Seleniivibrio woodruffii]|uniref:Phosphoribosylglycinamide formyltransferase n=1 Tax=Seleniivibrio woodruffii TaxID=1078050 RepID=A0A4R1KAV7_9BACT|nr:phosphoribosylglycinamide formyltransferase [Seleniivibrio woodruffii]TCK61606.1 phosphoribosylglycinamide formyltransferase-1 [Seleniivibrio woodruffii]TVZ35279.1 formyltetrahydrofolate-dependent phosphoribosylglycinamide formyltransferase [Seleniivibrio woodruffii]